MTTRSRLRGEFAVTKTFAEVQPGPDDESGPGTFSLILSTSDVDRDGEIVDAGAFDPLPDHIAMDIDHGMSVATTVASGVPTKLPDGRIRVDGSFASTELGQQTRTLVRERHVRTASVAMIPTKKTKDENGVTHVVKADLLNGAFTPVPSNRSAVVLSAKSAAKILDEADALLKAGRRNSMGDQAVVQAIHDLVANLGAICGNGSSEEGGSAGDVDRDGKSVADQLMHSVEYARARYGDGAAALDVLKTAAAKAKAENDELTKTTQAVAESEAESKSAADAAAVKAAADAADELDAEVWSAAALALTAVRDL